MKEFKWMPQWNAKRKKKPNVNAVTFGDGYEQRQPKGINNNLRTFDVVFKGSEEYINEIEAFLDEHGAVNAFLWTPYRDKQGKFKCEEWDTEFSTGFFVLTATFKEVAA